MEKMLVGSDFSPTSIFPIPLKNHVPFYCHSNELPHMRTQNGTKSKLLCELELKLNPCILSGVCLF